MYPFWKSSLECKRHITNIQREKQKTAPRDTNQIKVNSITELFVSSQHNIKLKKSLASMCNYPKQFGLLEKTHWSEITVFMEVFSLYSALFCYSIFCGNQKHSLELSHWAVLLFCIFFLQC